MAARTESSATEPGNARDGRDLVERSSRLGARLAECFTLLLAALPKEALGTVGLARHLGIDKVLASRLLKALRQNDPVATLHHMPGPDPLRRVAEALRSRGASDLTVNQSLDAIASFELLIREETGDRSALDAILAGLVPAARSGFELRRKQAAYRAMSQLKGVAARINIATVLLAPGSDPTRIDVVWVFGTLGIQRLRAGVVVKFASRRLGPTPSPRSPQTLAGKPVDAAVGLDDFRLDHHCTSDAPGLLVHRIGDVCHYALADRGFGPRSAVDLVFAEVNRNELDRLRASGPAAPTPSSAPPVRPRKTYFFAEVPIPTETLQFDVFVHDGVFPEQQPELVVYDTALEGVASPNDPARDMDRLDLAETVKPLGRGVDGARSRDFPSYQDVLNEVLGALAWDGRRFTGWRTRIDYPMYGSQVTLSFAPGAG